MKEKELKRLEALERKMDMVFKWVEDHQTKGKHTGEYAKRYPCGGVCTPIYVASVNSPGEPITINKGDTELQSLLKRRGIHIHKTDEPLDLTDGGMAM